MEAKDIRMGDWVRDPRNYNYEARADIGILGSAELFEGVEISPKILLANGLKENKIGSEIAYYIEKGNAAITVAKDEFGWRVSVRNGVFVYAGYLVFVHELQHAVSDCFIEFDWVISNENKN